MSQDAFLRRRYAPSQSCESPVQHWELLAEVLADRVGSIRHDFFSFTPNASP
jgi:hypothetical protein